jgi:hypothetical protein
MVSKRRKIEKWIRRHPDATALSVTSIPSVALALTGHIPEAVGMARVPAITGSVLIPIRRFSEMLSKVETKKLRKVV